MFSVTLHVFQHYFLIRQTILVSRSQPLSNSLDQCYVTTMAVPDLFEPPSCYSLEREY